MKFDKLSEGSWRKFQALTEAMRKRTPERIVAEMDDCLGAITLNIPMHAAGVHVRVNHIHIPAGVITTEMIRAEAARVSIELPDTEFVHYMENEGWYKLCIPESNEMDFGFKVLLVHVRVLACVYPSEARCKPRNDVYDGMLQVQRRLGNEVQPRIYSVEANFFCARIKPKIGVLARLKTIAKRLRGKRCVATVDVAYAGRITDLTGMENGFIAAAMFTAAVRGASGVLAWRGYCGINVPTPRGGFATDYTRIDSSYDLEYIRYRVIEVRMAIDVPFLEA